MSDNVENKNPIEPALVNLIKKYLARVAATNDYSDLNNLPNIPTKISDLENDLDLDEDIKKAIQEHNEEVDAHSNLYQIVEEGTLPIGLDNGKIYFELEKEVERIILSGLVINGDSNVSSTANSFNEIILRNLRLNSN